MKIVLLLFLAAMPALAQSTNAPPHPIISPGTLYLQHRATLYAITRTGLATNLGDNTLARWRASIEARGLETPSSLTPGIIAEAQRFRAAMLASTTPTLSPH